MTLPVQAHGILAHYFYDGTGPRPQGSLSSAEWARGLDAYGDRLISADKWIDLAMGDRLRDEVCVTLDDGLREAYVYALPELERRGLTACWNVYTQPLVGVPHNLERWRWVRNRAYGSLAGFYDAWDRLVDRERVEAEMLRADPTYLSDYGYLTPVDRIFRWWRNRLPALEYEQAMLALEGGEGARPFIPDNHWIVPHELWRLHNAGHVIGNHTHTHPMELDVLSEEQQETEWATAECLLTDFNPEVMTASYPCGRRTAVSSEWLAKHEYTLAWGATMKGYAPWEAPRLSTGYWPR